MCGFLFSNRRRKDCGRCKFTGIKQFSKRRFCSDLCRNKWHRIRRANTIFHEKGNLCWFTSKGKKFTFDKSDLVMVSKYNWHADTVGYATASSNRKLRLHVLIMGKTKGLETDHIDRNKLNNTRKNLRLVSHRENLQNVDWVKVNHR